MANFLVRNLRLSQKTASILSQLKQAPKTLSNFPTSHFSNISIITSENLCNHQQTRRLHTEGDRRFVELLDTEISTERDRADGGIQLSDGWETHVDGAEGSLVNNFNGDRITVYFNLNSCIPSVADEEDEQQSEGLVAYPDFTVQVEKDKSKNVMELECYFPDSSDEDVNESMFSIRTVTIHTGEIKESTYMMETENLDPDVYSYFLTFLADRGVDNQFAEELTRLCTSEENKAYIKSLEKLKSFIGCK